MVQPRTEEQKLTKAPITVMLGGKEYEIKPLVIRDAREWRKKLASLLSQLPAYVNITTDNPEGFAQAMNAMVGGMPDQMADLFFAYAKDLPRDEIEASATEVELGEAFNVLMGVAFPLLKSLTGAMAKVAQ